MHVSRRGFVTGFASLVGYAGLRPDNLFAQVATAAKKAATDVTAILTAAARNRVAEYDPMAKLSSNENPWGPLPSVMDAMNYAWKYSNRYGYPDGGLVEAIAQHHGVKPENILLGAGSGEILDVMALAFLEGKKKVLGVEPTYSTVYQRASQIKAESIKLPLNKDYSQSIPAFIEAANKHASEIGFIYLCNPNNPTGMIVSKAEVKQLLDGVPKGMPVMIDEAYHHFVQDPELRTVGAVRDRGPARRHRADLLEDLRHRRHAPGLRDCAAGARREDEAVLDGQHQLHREVGRGRRSGRHGGTEEGARSHAGQPQQGHCGDQGPGLRSAADRDQLLHGRHPS